MVNIYDSANQVAADLQKIDEFKTLKDAIAAVKENADSTELFKKMNKIQSDIFEAQSQGKDVPKQVQEDYQKLNEQVQKDQPIMNLLLAEQGIYKTIDDVQRAVTQPINDLYEGLRN